jgi:hypothetical protein
MSIFDRLPEHGWGTSKMTNGELRTLLKIMLELDDTSDVCEYVVLAKVYDGDSVRDVEIHPCNAMHRGLVHTSLEPEDLQPFIDECMGHIK